MTLHEASLPDASPRAVYGEAANPYGRAATIGVVAGLRSMLAPAAVRLEARDRAFGFFALAALGELAGDKLPAAPARTAPPVLAGRVVLGAYAGSALAARFGGDRLVGVVLGAIGAVAGTFAGYGIRKAIVAATPLPDALVALGEDAVAVSLAISSQRRPPDRLL